MLLGFSMISACLKTFIVLLFLVVIDVRLKGILNLLVKYRCDKKDFVVRV